MSRRRDNEPVTDASSGSAAYQPGVCNIGPAEIARRRRAATNLTILTAIVAGALLAADVPPLLRIAVLPLSAAAGVTWLQVVRRFCVAFGAAGVLNFGVLGGTKSVEALAARAADRRTAFRMIVEGSFYGLIAAIALVLLPL